MPGGSLLGSASSRSRDSALVSLALLATSLIGAGQALAVAFLVGRGGASDAFFASYSLYVPLAVLGTSLRSTLVPLLGVPEHEGPFRERAGLLVARVALIALVAAGFFALSTQALAPLIAGGSQNAQSTARITLLVLTPAIALQIYAGAASATLNAVRRFSASAAVYVGSSAFALLISVLLLSQIGILGAPLGLLAGAVLLAATHRLYLRRFGVRARPRIRWLRDVQQGRLARRLSAGVTLGASQQLSLAVALASLSGDPGQGTLYAYAFYATALFTNMSVVPLALVMLPDFVKAAASEGIVAMQRQLNVAAPIVFALLAPMLAAFTAFGEPVLQLFLGPSLSREAVRELYEIALLLQLVVIPTVIFALAASMTVALKRWRQAVAVAATSVLAHVVTISLVSAGGAMAVAAGHAFATSLATVMLVVSLFGRATPSAVADLARAAVPAFALALVFPVVRLPLGEQPGPLLVGLGLVIGIATYSWLAMRLWPSVARRFLSLVRRPV